MLTRDKNHRFSWNFVHSSIFWTDERHVIKNEKKLHWTDFRVRQNVFLDKSTFNCINWIGRLSVVSWAKPYTDHPLGKVKLSKSHLVRLFRSRRLTSSRYLRNCCMLQLNLGLPQYVIFASFSHITSDTPVYLALVSYKRFSVAGLA